jgi:hypothetical protein
MAGEVCLFAQQKTRCQTVSSVVELRLKD